ILLALPHDDGGSSRSAAHSPGEHPGALDRIDGKVGTGLLLQLESVPPGGEFVGPCLDRIDMASRRFGYERAAPAVVAVMAHRLPPPLPVLCVAPDQRCCHHIVSVAINVRPDLDALAHDPLHGKAAAVDARINVFDM